MSTIDNRIVQMKFDNKQFESGIQSSVGLLDKLKQSLKLEGATDGLAKLKNMGQNFSLDGITSAVETATSRFSALNVMALGALASIGAAAASTGISMIKSLTIDPIMDGLSEYEIKMNAIQTILTNTSSKGTTLDQVNTALGELNEYADLTIYNFAQMTDNIGKMTAAGLGLKDSVSVVKGMSNVAAGFGVDATRMAGATYQMSQALSAGVIKLMDWKSLEQSGMGGEMLQKELLATAKSMGKVVDAGAPFRETLEKGWLTTDVFVKTMEKMSTNKLLTDAAQNVTSLTKLFGTMKESVGSGWAQTWENIFGNKDQSTKLFTDMNNGFNSIIGPSTEARNAMWAFWNQNGGRDAFIKGLSNICDSISKIVKPITSAFKEIFPPEMGMNLVAISKGFESFTSRLVMSDSASNNLKDTLRGFWSVIAIPVDALKLLGSVVFTVVSKVVSVLGTGLGFAFTNILKVTGAIGDFIADLRAAVIAHDLLSFAMGKLTAVSKYWKTAFGGMFSCISTGIDSLINFIQTSTLLTDVMDGMKYIFGKVASGFSYFGDALNGVGAEIMTSIQNSGILSDLINGLESAFKSLKQVLLPIKTAFYELSSSMSGDYISELSDSFKGLVGNFKIGELVTSSLKVLFQGLVAVLNLSVKAFGLVAGSVGFLANKVSKALIPVLGGLFSMAGKLSNFLIYVNDSIQQSGILATTVEQMGNAFEGAQDGISKTITALGPVTTGILSSAAGVLIKLYDAVMLLFKGTTVCAAELDNAKDTVSNVAVGADKLKDSVDGVGSSFSKITGVIVNTAKAIGKFLAPILDSLKKKFDEFTIQDLGSLLTGAGLLIFAKALAKGISSIDGIMSSFSGVLDQVGNTLKAFQLKVKAKALMNIAIALAILTASLVALSFIDLADLAKGLATLTVVFGELIVGLMIMNKKIKDVKQITAQMVALGVGMLLLAYSVKILSSMDIPKLIQGTAAIASLMTVIALFVNLTKKGDLKKSAGGLISFAIGITILSGALYILGSMDVGKLTQGVASIATLMTMIATFVNLTQKGDLAKSAGGLVGFSVGITILCGALAILGKMDVDTLKQGTIAIATLMTMIATFVNLTQKGDLAKSAGGLVGFAIGITILCGALAILGKMDVGNLIQGTVAIAALMTTIAMFIDLTRGGDLATSAGGLIGFSVGIMILASAVKLLASIDQKGAIQGMTVIASLMVTIAMFIDLTKGGDLAKSAGGLVGFATGLMILAGVIAILSALNPKKLLMASAAICALIATIGLFVNVTRGGDLAKSAGGLIIFAVAIGALSASLILLGKLDYKQLLAGGLAITALLLSILAFTQLTSAADLIATSIGLVAFSGALMLMTQALITLGGIDILTLLTGLGVLAGLFVVLGVASVVLGPLTPVMLGLSAAIALLGVAFLGIGVGMLAFATGLSILAQTGSAGATALTQVVTSLIALIPLALTTLAVGILQFIKVIGDNAPIVAASFMKIVNAILDTAKEVIPKLVDAGMRLVLGILKGISDHIYEVVIAGANIIINFLNGIREKLPAIVDVAFKVIISFINGLAQAIDNNHQALYSACRNLVQSIVNAIVDLIPTMVGVGQDLIKGCIRGIGSMAKELWDTAVNIFKDTVEGVKKFLGIHSPSRVFAQIGEYTGQGFINGLSGYSTKIGDAATNMGAQAVDSMSNAISGISNIISGNIDTNPVIRPVLDLSDVQNGTRQLYGMMNNKTFAGSVKLANDASTSFQASVKTPRDTVEDLRNVIRSEIGRTNSDSRDITQNVNIYSPTALSPSETARQNKRVLQEMAFQI